MEDSLLEEPSWPTLDNSEQEKPEMKTPTNSFEIKGPFPDRDQWYYTLYDDGDRVAEVSGSTQQAALENALLLAAAPRMADVLEFIGEEVNGAAAINELANAYQESQGLPCEACETLGQPSRMVYSPTNRLYHPTCLPADVKKAIAEEAKAASEDDVPW